jgi:hypothetical protein
MSLFHRSSNGVPVRDCARPRHRKREPAAGKAFFQIGWPSYTLVVTTLVWALTTFPSLAIDVSNTRGALSLVNRSVTQDQGAWVVNYRLRYTGKAGAIVTPDKVAVKAEGWVSNSRVANHALPRWSSLVIAHGPDLSATSEVITATEEAHRCRERLAVSIWTEDQGPLRAGPGTPGNARPEDTEAPVSKLTELAAVMPLSLGPDTIVRVQLRFEHQHILYGEYDPLFAVRAVTLTLGSASVVDVITLDREQYLAQPRFTWPEPPEERRDTRHAVSGPDSLHLEAHVPGHQYYRYLDRPVRYSTKMRLRFWYLIAAGTEGDCKVKVTQQKDTSISWRMLNSGGFEQCLKTIGRWTKVERIIQTESEATTLTLEFKIVGETEVGEMWIDDVSLEPVGYDGLGGP